MFQSQIAELWFPYDRTIADDRKWSQMIAEDRTSAIIWDRLRSQSQDHRRSQKCVFIWLQMMQNILWSAIVCEKAGEWRSTPGVSKKLGRSGHGVGRKGIACSQSQTFYQTLFAHERGVVVQFDWLLARQSKYGIRNKKKIKIDMAESEEAFEGVFEFFVQEMSKDLSQNGKLIILKLDQEAAITE